MTEKESKDGYFKAHTVEVTLDGVKQRVAVIYLKQLQKKLGKRLEVSTKEEAAAASYIKDVKARDAETEKVRKAAIANASKVGGKAISIKKADKLD